MFKPFLPKEVWIERRVEKLETTQEILNRLNNISIKQIETINEIVSSEHKVVNKNILVLAKQEGEFFKPCPGTQNYACCNYHFLNLATNCDVGCTYCILQGYLNNPYMTVYVNLDDMFDELETLFSKNQNRFYRLGTGELTDSLTIDHITHYSKKLIPFFMQFSNAILELKTKTTQIHNLLKFSPQNKVIVSWSLNPDELINTEEKNAPSVRERLEAAEICSDKGYLIGFHFDPMIYYKNWEKGYRAIVREIFNYISPKKIVWISLGALRYPAEMDKIVRERHPESDIVLGEMFPGKDGKLRYFRPVREEMFQKMVQWFREEDENIQLYLCMESPEVWRAAPGLQSLSKCGIPKQLDRAVFKCRNDLTLKDFQNF